MGAFFRLQRSGARASWVSAKAVVAGLILCLLIDHTAIAAPAERDLGARLDRILARTPLIDGHNDLPWQIRERFAGKLSALDLHDDTSKLTTVAGAVPLMTDIGRLRAGDVGAQFWSVWIPVQIKGFEAVQTTMEQIDLVKDMTRRYPADLEMAY